MPYICDKCKGLFVEPATYVDCLALDPPTYEERTMSPCCCDGYRRVRRCPDCGDYTSCDSSDGLCDSCARDAVDDFKRRLGLYSISAIRLLDRLLDGVSLEEFRDGK